MRCIGMQEGRAAGRSIECRHHTHGLGQERRRPATGPLLPPRLAPNRISAVGFNPYRQQRRRRSDYVFVAAAFVVVAVLLVWALLPA